MWRFRCVRKYRRIRMTLVAALKIKSSLCLFEIGLSLGRLAMVVGGDGSLRRKRSCLEFSDRNTNFLGSATGQIVESCGETHQVVDRLNSHVIPGPLFVTLGVAVPGSRAINDAWPDCLDVLVSKTAPVQITKFVTLNEVALLLGEHEYNFLPP